MSRVWIVPATIVTWHDADTPTALLDLGFAISYRAKIRIDGIDAPELATKAGKAAVAWARELIPDGSQVIVTSRQWDKYGRVTIT